ncbi:tetratricopeptide repeat protein 9C-like isoform X2 [Dysidea avara]|uniref:tetratricopeptide repeat protein 9C-like isoform X2 n=1 Tax=Dysidea avara TaxID=196820 RepID=UPI0033199D15
MSADTLEAATSVDQGSASQGEMETEAIQKEPGTHVAATPASVQDRKINSDKLGKAKELKDSGNELFKNGNTKNATKKYHQALMYVKGVLCTDTSVPGIPEDLMYEKVTKEEKAIGDELTALLHNNLAACLVKTTNWENVIKHTSQIQPENAKALYRRGMAYYETNSLLKAEEDLEKAKTLAPKDQNIVKQLDLVKSKLKTYEDQEKKIYTNMFSS